MIRSRHKNQRLIHNPAFPVERSKEVIDQWLEALKDESLAKKLGSVQKRLFIDTHFFDSGGERYRAKYYRTLGMKRRLEALFLKAESVRNFRASLKVEEAGLQTATPLCLWGSWPWGFHRESILFMKDLGDLPALPEYLDSLDPADGDAKSNLAEALALDLAKLHDEGIYVHDPSKNILVIEKSGGVRFVFIDFDTVRWYLPVNKEQVARVLRHCIRPPGDLEFFTRDEIGVYVRTYLKARGLAGWFDSVFPMV